MHETAAHGDHDSVFPPEHKSENAKQMPTPAKPDDQECVIILAASESQRGKAMNIHRTAGEKT
jgi:hypothetical protein